MKTVTRLTAAVALVIAVSAPAFADNMKHVGYTAGTQAQAYVPPAQGAQDPAALAAQY